MKEKIKKVFDKKYLKNNINVVILGILIFIFLVATLLYLILSKNISEIERKKLIDETTPYINYIEDVENSTSKDLDKYIIFALDYNNYEKANNSITCKEISDFINNVFNIEVKEEDIKNQGITPDMLEKNIIFDLSSKKYSIKIDELNKRDLEEKEVIYYKLDKIHKVNKKKYKITYKKYIIKEPFELLNYILELNTNNDKSEIDITNLREYFQTGNVKKIKDFLNESSLDLDEYIKKSKKIKITYIVTNDNKLQIYKIK